MSSSSILASSALLALLTKLVAATPACPAITFTNGVSHDNNGITVTFTPDAGQTVPDWVIAHITKDVPQTGMGTISTQVNIATPSLTSPNANFTAATNTFQWLVTPAQNKWQLSDVPFYYFTYAVTIDGSVVTCDAQNGASQYFTPAVWPRVVTGACPSVPTTQGLTETSDNKLHLTFSANPGFLAPTSAVFAIGKNCNSTDSTQLSTISSVRAADSGATITSNTVCGYNATIAQWFCDVDRTSLGFTATDKPCFSTTYSVNDASCNTPVWYPGFQWVWQQTQNWTTCSTTCGAGVQTAAFTCVGNDGTADPTGYSCDIATMPATSRTCNVQACPSYQNSTWTTCSKTCGLGSQTRTVSCVNPATGATVANSQCTGVAGATIQACNTFACPTWKLSAFSLCSTTCGTGVQTATAVCTAYDGSVLADSACTSDKPATTQVCTNLAVCPSSATSAPTSAATTTAASSTTVAAGTAKTTATSAPTSASTKTTTAASTTVVLPGGSSTGSNGIISKTSNTSAASSKSASLSIVSMVVAAFAAAIYVL